MERSDKVKPVAALAAKDKDKGESMKEPVLSVSEVKELMEAFTKSGLGSMELKQGEFILALESRKVEQFAFPQQNPASFSATPQSVPCDDEKADEPCGNLVTSPIVGTFYEAPSPDKPPFVKVGQRVKKGDVLFIIESMKLMNEVLSDFDGLVAEILVHNAQPVEYGEAVLRIE